MPYFLYMDIGHLFYDNQKCTDYFLGEAVYGHPSRAKRGRYRNVDLWSEKMAQDPVDAPAFTNVGRWSQSRKPKAGDYDQPVFVPWIFFDIDRKEAINEAFWLAQDIIETLESLYYDIEQCVVSFSGSKGLHVQVPSTQIKAPVFTNTPSAYCFLKHFIKDVADTEIDTSVASPQSLIRRIGSKHDETGIYKTAMWGDTFRDMALSEYMDSVVRVSNAGEYTPFMYRTYRSVDPIPEKRIDHIYRVCELVDEEVNANEAHPTRGSSSQNGQSMGIIDAIRGGIQEGEQFGDKYFHVGRENASFIMGCWLLDRYPRHKAWEQLKKWNENNNPPVKPKRLKTQFRGAKRKLNYDTVR